MREIMYQRLKSSKTQLEKAMTDEQFEQIVDAIILGKYSWACLLILRFAGYNPLHYIPYRTYNRLLKNNSINQTAKTQLQKSSAKLQDKHYPKLKLQDLPYQEEIEHESVSLRGGCNKTTFRYFIPNWLLGEVAR